MVAVIIPRVIYDEVKAGAPVEEINNELIDLFPSEFASMLFTGVEIVDTPKGILCVTQGVNGDALTWVEQEWDVNGHAFAGTNYYQIDGETDLFLKIDYVSDYGPNGEGTFVRKNGAIVKELEESLQRATEEIVKEDKIPVPDFETVETPAREIRNLAYDLYDTIGEKFEICSVCRDEDSEYECSGFDKWDGRQCWFMEFASVLHERGWRNKQ